MKTPFKRKFLRAIYAPGITKRLRKAMMKIYDLKSMYLNIQAQDSIKSYKKQENVWTERTEKVL